MIGYVLKHAFSYLLLLLIFIGGLMAYFWLPQSDQKIVVSMGLVILYLLWGIWHHYEEGNLTATIFLEYLVVAMIIFWLLVSLA